MFSMNSSFWRHRAYADILVIVQIFMKISVTPTYTRVHISFWLFVRNTKNSYITHTILDDKKWAVPNFQRAVVTVETDKLRIV